jgi:mannose-6-phosphate isomerase-like protein (cupin superfamily)
MSQQLLLRAGGGNPVNLKAARAELERRLLASPDPTEEESVILGYADGAEVCLMGWMDRTAPCGVKNVPTHVNAADSMQIVLEGGMEIYYPEEDTVVTLQAGDCHVVPRGKIHACVSRQRSLVLVVVGHRAGLHQ